MFNVHVQESSSCQRLLSMFTVFLCRLQQTGVNVLGAKWLEPTPWNRHLKCRVDSTSSCTTSVSSFHFMLKDTPTADSQMHGALSLFLLKRTGRMEAKRARTESYQYQKRRSSATLIKKFGSASISCTSAEHPRRQWRQAPQRCRPWQTQKAAVRRQDEGAPINTCQSH